ncbi:hypothetical protein ACPOL_7175 (plasmid) [Acidisarcina polymorpha]|uniref:ASPIC/UnbV domain-containing protein n=1 Tax=Acidisarcina polymorpha TaxID=2211140 RepID=A0A2Z5GCL7_9BACT|nr:CRTAC1 family protein [Acidisarcina polymorpha]AXC16365.1 hypothetical protein ACPOL_7175 [Acidisarcina polymorpha]
MPLTRRSFLTGLVTTTAVRFTAQQSGSASRDLRSQPREKLSGKPFSRFVDVAHASGLTQIVPYGGVDKKQYILEANGCGCAFIDYDNDGWMDVFLLSGTKIEGAPPGATNRLYHNNRDGTFTDITVKANLTSVGWASGVCVGDYNNDGFDDLFCTAYGRNYLFRNNGNGTFTDVTKEAALLSAAVRWGTGCSFLDYNRDGHLDLFVANYVQFDIKTVPLPAQNPSCNFKGNPVYCGPRGLQPGHHSLYRNNGDGTFTDVSAESGISKSTKSYGLTVVTSDVDQDGWPDIFVACDSTPSLLFMNNRDGTFREEGTMRGVALSGDGYEQAGMGVGVGDINLDGHTDILKTHFSGDASGLFHNDGKGYFDDVTYPSHLAVETRYVSWGAGIVDLDNDGWPDLFVVTGSVYPEMEARIPEYANKGPRIIFRNLGNGIFEELTGAAYPVSGQLHSSRGCAFGDFDNDGDLDVLVMNMNEPPSLLRNDVPSGSHWLKIKLLGTKSNRSAIGSRVLVRFGRKLQCQELLSQSSYLSCNDPRLHFGLGPERIADVDIHWPAGGHDKFSAIKADQLITIQEGAGIVPNHGWANAHAK